MDFKNQEHYRRMGVNCADAGLTREDCPYEKDTPEWNMWVYGNDNRWGERFQTECDGAVRIWCTTSVIPSETYEAIEQQQDVFSKWKHSKVIGVKNDTD